MSDRTLTCGTCRYWQAPMSCEVWAGRRPSSRYACYKHPGYQKARAAVITADEVNDALGIADSSALKETADGD